MSDMSDSDDYEYTYTSDEDMGEDEPEPEQKSYKTSPSLSAKTSAGDEYLLLDPQEIESRKAQVSF